jgi:hypothetical protein
MSSDGARLDVTADLSIEVDGAPVRVTAEGGDLRVVAADVRGFMLGLRAAATARNGTRPGRADVGDLAEAMAGAGLTARLASPSRSVVTLGAGVDSTLGGLLLGTRRARPDTLGILRASGRARAVGAAATGALLLGIAVVRRRGRAVEGTATS